MNCFRFFALLCATLLVLAVTACSDMLGGNLTRDAVPTSAPDTALATVPTAAPAIDVWTSVNYPVMNFEGLWGCNKVVAIEEWVSKQYDSTINEYDANGKLGSSSVETWTREGDFRIKTIRGADGSFTRETCDSLNRPVKHYFERPDGTFDLYTDAFVGDTIRKSHADCTGSNGPKFSVEYLYDDWGNNTRSVTTYSSGNVETIERTRDAGLSDNTKDIILETNSNGLKSVVEAYLDGSKITSTYTNINGVNAEPTNKQEFRYFFDDLGRTTRFEYVVSSLQEDGAWEESRMLCHIHTYEGNTMIVKKYSATDEYLGGYEKTFITE